MKTAKELEEDLQTGVERDAAAPAGSSTKSVEKALPETRAKLAHQAERRWVTLTTVKGRGMRPGIDLDSSSSLLQRMEEQESFP